jgi:hypothetical protein
MRELARASSGREKSTRANSSILARENRIVQWLITLKQRSILSNNSLTVGSFAPLAVNVFSAQFVLADGRIVLAADDSEEELFWAPRSFSPAAYTKF